MEPTTLGQVLDRQFDRDKEAWEALKASGRVEAHGCGGKHVVVRNVTDAEFNAVARGLVYVFGHDPYWNTNPRKVDGKKVYDIEAVYQCTGGPSERCSKPWQGCGTSVLFEDWHRRVEAQEAVVDEARKTLRPGTKVSFQHGGRVHVGIVVGVSQVTVTVVVEGEGNWRIVPQNLTVL
jgi:hypothetical protein